MSNPKHPNTPITNQVSSMDEMEWRPFPVKVLPATVGDFVAETATAHQCDEAFVVLPLISALAAAIGNSRRIKLKSGFEQPSVIWTCVISDSGTGKSPAQEKALHFSRDRQNNVARQREGNKKRKNTKKGGSATEWYVVQDITLEALAGRLYDSPRGLLLATDEMSTWFGSFGQYGGSCAKDIGCWASTYDATSIEIDRKTGQKKIFVERSAVSIAGAIQPGTLARLITRRHFESGILARIIWAMPPFKASRWTDATVSEATHQAMQHVFDELWQLPVQGLALPLNAEAQKRWNEFHDAVAEESESEPDPDMRSAQPKVKLLASRLALVCQLAKKHKSRTIDAPAMNAGIEMARWFTYETRRVYDMLKAENNGLAADKKLQDVLAIIRENGGRITSRNLRDRKNFLRKPGAAEAMLEKLRAEGYGRWMVPNNNGPGRPPEYFELHHPG